MIDVSVIIVNYNTRDLTLNCLKSIYERTEEISFEIIVVDNASADDSVKAIKENFPEVKVIESHENLGFGRANNLGAKYANGRNLFFLNPDTILLNNAIAILCKFLDGEPLLGICGGNLFDEKYNPTHSFKRKLPSVFTELNTLLFGLLDKIYYGQNINFNFTGKPLKVGYITGADMMMKKELFVRAEGFNPSFFMYYEETELTFRVKRKNFEVMSVPDAKIQHLEGSSFHGFNEQRERAICTGRILYNRLTMSKLRSQIVDLIYCLSIVQRIFFHSFFQRNKRQYWIRKRNLFLDEKKYSEAQG